MADHVRLLHTAQVHVARFDALRDAIAPGIRLTHVVRGDLLERAQKQGVTQLIRAELRAELNAGTAAGMPVGATICTCTTLGPAAEDAGAIRIDRPMMDAAALLGGRVLLVVVLDSTIEASCAALAESIATAKTTTEFEVLLIPEVWHLFVAGDGAGFARAIATRVNAAVRDHSAVILAQVSMTDAAQLIEHATVLTAPELALRFAISR